LIAGSRIADARKTVREMWTTLDSFARARLTLRAAKRGERIRCYGRLLVEGSSAIEIGERVVFLNGMLPTELRSEKGGEIVIGARTIFNYGVSLVARRSIRIGERCMFGSLVQIRDDDGRRSAPVVIGNDVWVAHGALLEPGAVVGDGSVVAAGAVVTTTVPPRMLAFGNPARFFPLEATDESLAAADAQNQRPSYVRLATDQAASRAMPEMDGAQDDSLSRPSREEVRLAIITWLDDTRLFGDAVHLIASDAMSLREVGLLDSLGLVELVLMLEHRFGITIDRALASQPGHQTMNHFLDLVATSPRLSGTAS
jgi:acetyltransferase-like isoleucine patch superfamily enzyme/acyl carrier protein